MIKTGLFLLALAGTASAQRLYFASGDVEWSEVTLSGTNLQKRVKTADGREAVTSIPASTVTRVDWQYPDELVEALQDLLHQKYDAALKKADAVREIHRNWKDKPGAWYYQATLYSAEASIRLGNAEATDKLMTELRTATLPAGYQKALSFVQAVEELSKKKTGPAYTKVQIVFDAADSSLAARGYLLAGDIKLKQEEYREALDAYLQVPVFFGAQGALMAPAELGAATALRHLGRLSDSSSALARVIERYKGTPEAAEAAKLKEDVDRALTGGGGGAEKSEAEPEAKPEAKPD
jgi:tetratricopeptide (TPR) repeat protein